MNVAVLIIIAITLAVVGVSLYLQHRKPKLKVVFPGDNTELTYRIGEKVEEVPIYYKNMSRFTITGLDICVFVPPDFFPKKLEYPGGTTDEMAQKPPRGTYKNMKYLYTGEKFVLAPEEEDVIKLYTVMPKEASDYSLIVHTMSKQGDAGTYTLKITVY